MSHCATTILIMSALCHILGSKHQKAHHFTFRLPSPVQQENNPVCHVIHCQSVSPLDCDILYVSVLLFCMTTLGHVDAGPAYPPTAGVSSSSAGRGPPSGPPPSGRPPPEPLPGIPPVQPQRRHIQHLFCCFGADACALPLLECSSNQLFIHTGTNVVPCTLCCCQSAKLSSCHAMELVDIETFVSDLIFVS